uniref:Uncharacterized protein n=1 Tax=Sander lucioperca TaxID=283035 RepID=A0A8C9ZL61_SANLU
MSSATPLTSPNPQEQPSSPRWRREALCRQYGAYGDGTVLIWTPNRVRNCGSSPVSAARFGASSSCGSQTTSGKVPLHAERGVIPWAQAGRR